MLNTNQDKITSVASEIVAVKQLQDLVVIGSSAGGIEALSVLVSTLPENFPAPIVLAQHLDPNYHSTLHEILQRRTLLPVEIVTTNIKLEPGHIYVVPANNHVVIHDNQVELQGDHMGRPRPSVDLLLSSAATYYGENLIAVILTGSGHDGTAGAIDVKNAGGTVIVQNPQTARYPSMPAALPSAIVDFEVELVAIGPLLYNLLTNEDLLQPPEKSEDLLQQILERVKRQANIDFRPYKIATILRRISRRVNVTGNASLLTYTQYMDSHPQEVGELVNALLINVTQFFRDPEAFNYLKAQVLPALIEKARKQDRVLRLWSAGCATGEEPYSLAMLLADLLGAELSDWSIKIFATDLDKVAVSFARQGIYAENLLRGVPDNYRNRFFEQTEQGFAISKLLRSMVIFGQQDLSRSAPFPRVDLLLCRNVLIYFTPELQEYVLNQFVFSLFSKNGYLFLGKAETIRPNQISYKQITKQWKIFHCVSEALPMIRRHDFTTMHSTITEYPNGGAAILPTSSSLVTAQESNGSVSELNQLRRFNELLLRFLPVGVAVIDRNYRLLTVNSTARRLLGLRENSTEHDFLHAVHGIPYPMVRNAIDSVFRDRNTVALAEVELQAEMGGNGRYLSISIALIQMEGGLPDLAAISINDVTSQVQIRHTLEASQAEQSKLVSELNTVNRHLSELNKEFMDANEELQVANEELVLTHEELQATIEEFETTNEELQATNEEMETTNEELQATNEELNTTNEELRARTNDLQEAAEQRESERLRLHEMVELAPFYVMVLRGSSLILETFNPIYSQLLSSQLLRGRTLEQALDYSQAGNQEIIKLAQQVYQTDKILTSSPISTKILTETAKADQTFSTSFIYQFVPTHNVRGSVSGVIVYASQISDHD